MIIYFIWIFINCDMMDADIAQILLEAKHRWLRPAEICEILRNYKKFHISSEPASMPPGMIFQLH